MARSLGAWCERKAPFALWRGLGESCAGGCCSGAMAELFHSYWAPWWPFFVTVQLAALSVFVLAQRLHRS
jgi:hypothetical protein